MLPGMTTVKSIASSILLLNYICNDLYHNRWLISMHGYQYRSYYSRYDKMNNLLASMCS